MIDHAEVTEMENEVEESITQNPNVEVEVSIRETRF